MPKSFNEWKKGEPRSFDDWKTEQQSGGGNAGYSVQVVTPDPYEQYLKKLNQTYQTHNTAYQALKQKRTAAPAYDPDLAGYATDPLAMEQLRKNDFTLKDALQQVTEGTKAQAAKQEYTQLKDYKTYSDKLNEYKGDSEAMYQAYNKQIQELEKQYQTSPGTWRETRRQVKALEKERDWLKSYGDSLKQSQEDAALVDAWAKGHGGNYESYQEARNRLQAAEDKITLLTQAKTNAGANDYSGYATDELGQQILAQQQATGSTWTAEQDEELRAALKERDQARKILNYASQHQTDELSKRPDYDRVAAEGESRFQAYKQQQTQERTTIETNPYAPATVNPYDPTYYSEFREPDNRWTEEEKKNFYYLFATDRERAYQYGADVEQRYNAEDARRKGEATAAKASKNFISGVGYSVASVPANLVGGLIDYAKMGMEYAARGDIYETQYQGASLWAENVRGGIAQKLNESGTISDSVPVLGGKGLGDLYQLMMSMADSSVSVMAGGGAANVVFFGSAAASTTRQALERGVSGSKAVALGFAAGAAEVLGETLSVEHLLKQGDVADYLRKGLLREMAKQGGVEASEEVLTTILNTLADAVINGDESEFQQKVYAYVADGMGYNDAVRKARIEWIEGLGEDALGGFLSGGLMSGGRLALQGASAAMTTYEGDTKGLFQRAALAEEGGKTASLAKQYQQQLEKKGSISNLQAARLQANLSHELNANDRPQIERDLRKKLSEDRFSYLSEMEKDNMVERVLDEALNGSHEGRELNDLEQRFADEIVTQLNGDTVPTGNWIETRGLKNVQDAKISEERFKTVELKEGGERVSVKSAKMVDGKLTFTYEQNGKDVEVTQEDLKLDGDQAKILKEMTERLGEDAASAFNSIRPGQFRFISDVTRFANAFATVRDIFGTHMTDENADRLERAALDSPLRRGLTDGQVLAALKIGQTRGRQVREQIKSARGTGEINMNGVTIKGENGKDIKLNGLKNQEKVKLSKKYKLIQGLAKAFGIDMVLYDSEDGKTSRLNGAYQDGVIYLDWSALQSGDKKTADWVMFRTLAHELTHFIQQNAAEEYQELKEFVTYYLAKSKDLDFNELVEQKMAREERQLTYEEAVDEVVADACETMLRDSEYVQQMMEEKPGLFQTIRNWIRKVLRRIEAQDDAAKELQPVVNELRALWDKGLRTAVESREAVAAASEEMKADVLESNAEELTDTEIDPTRETETVVLPNGQQYSIRSMRHDIAEGKMFQDLERYTDMSRKEIRELEKNLTRLTDIIALNRDILDLNESFGKDNRPFKPYKPNSDPLYTISLDFSTLCRKRLMTQYVIEKLQTELTDSQTGKRGRPLTAEEQLAVRDLMKEYAKQEKALKVACAMCYVEAARLKAPNQIQRFMRDPTEPMRRYFALRNSEFNASVRKAQADFKEQHGYARDAKKADMKPADVKALNKLSDRLRSEYQLSAEEQRELDIAKTLPNETYLTAANLAKLAEEHPIIYDAYTATIRSATRSKSLEADIPYYYGDSKRPVSDDFIAAVNQENGMRFSSWSDFQIQHMLDMMTAVIELSTRHCAMHGYTKFLEQVRIFGKTGMMFNMSGVANGTGLKSDGSLDFSPTESVLVYGQDGEYDAIRARDEFPETAGLQCIGISTEHIQALLDSDIIDYIIPYHTSGLNATLRRMAQISNWKDFTAFQNAKVDSGIKFDPSIHNRETWHKEPVFSEFFNAAKQASNGYRAGEKGVVTMRRAADLYKQMCRERGLMPKFSWGNSKVDADFSNDSNYWKLLIDRKMINQKTGALIEQKPVRPDFDFKLIEQMVQEAVDAYDPTLQDRALGYVRDHLDELPQRIADLKKAGAVKKATSKATKTLQAGPVAAVSEANAEGGKLQMSTRQTAEEVEAEAVEMSDVHTQFSVRKSDPPKKTLIGYKVFMVDKKHPGQLYPTKVKNPGGQGTPVGVWLDADTGEIARNPDGSIATNTVGRISVKANGGSLAWRPGWHLGSLPEANQMNRVDPKNPESNNSNRGTTGLMWDNYVFCECEFAADEDYQLEAFEYGTDAKGSYKHTQAGLPYIPKDGYYKYRTNPDPSTAPWFISGSIRITRILDDDMRREIIEKWNAEHPNEQMRFTERYSGKPINLEEYGFKAGPVTPTEDLSSVAPGVDYSDEIRNLPGYTRHALNFDDPRVQEAFRIQQIEDKKDYYIDKYNREHREELENGSKKAATAGGKVQFEVRRAADGRHYVDVQQDYLAGVPQNKWEETARNMLKTRFNGSIMLGRNPAVVNRVSRRELTHSRDMIDLYNKNPQRYADKLRALYNTDEIFQIATGWIDEQAKHARKDKIESFARGDVLMKIGQNKYSGEAIVGTRQDGQMLLYDIVHLKPAQFSTRKTDTVITDDHQIGGVDSAASASVDNVSQNAEESKGKLQGSSRNLGYHAGDLGKAEFLKQQGRYRGTGHFGTGTYFVGEEEKVTKDSHYGKRPQHAVDFTDYNLFKVRTDRQGYQLHDALRIIDGGIKREWIRPAMENQFNIISPTGYYDLARSKYGESWALGDNLRNAMLEYAANNGISIQTLDEFKKEHGFEADDPDAGYYYDDYVQETLKEEIGKVNDEYREFMDAVFDLHILPGFSNSKIFSALQAVADYQDATPRDARADSYATTFMKAMGYEGVDVRGTGLDNTQYGSVIYDVKPATIAYSMRSDAKTDRELLKAAYQDLVQQKQSAINELQAEQKKALEDFNKAVTRYESKEREATAALDELDKAVQGGDPKAVQAARTKVSQKEEQLANALDNLTKSMNGTEIQQILRQERAIQRERTTRKLRETANRRELRQRINKLWKDLNAKTVKATKDKRVPKELMQQAVDVLAAINMDSTREGSQAGEKLRSKLLELKQKYEEIKNDADFDKAAVYDPIVAELMQKMVTEVGDTPINKMTAAQLETVYNTLKALDVTARKALKIQLGEEERDAYEAAMEMTREARMRGKKTGAIQSYLNAQLSPERMFRRLGGYTKDSTWEKVYDMLNAGQLKQTRLQVEGSMIFEDLLESKDYEKFIDPKNLVDVGLKDENGKTIQITHGMLVSLYMHLMNEQNARHVAWGGLTIPALADYYNGKKAKGSENAVRVGGALQEVAEIRDRLRETEDEAEIAELEARLDELQVEAMDYVTGLQTEIEKKLTDYDRQWIAACRELFDEFTKRELNATTMDVYGIKRANVENYFPIWVDGDFLNTPFESVARDMSLENVGFMKERVDSSKPIRLADVSDVAASQIRKVSQYAGMMPAIRDFNKIWGKVETGYRDSLQKAVHDNYGDSGVKYIENLMADLNGARGGSDTGLGEFLNRMRGHMAQASLTLSLRTALGQTASYPTAASVLGWDALRKGLAAGKVDRDLILKWSPLLKYRMSGYSTAELGDIAGMNDKLSRLWRKARWATGWIQAMDGLTITRLWPAAEAWVQANRKDLAKGTDAYYEAVATKFNEAIEATQPNYSAMQRPDILRNPNALVKQLTMFLTQRLQNFNILYDACANYSAVKADFKAKRNGVTAEDVHQAAVASRTAVVSQVAASATIVAFKALADLLLHSLKAYRDDDEELTAESISLELLDMFLDALAGNVLGGSEAYDLIESKVFGKTYYGIEVSGVSTVTDLIDAVSKVYDHVAKAATDEDATYGKDQILKDLDMLAKRFGPVAGIPYANAKKIIMGGAYWVEDAVTGDWLEAGVDRTTTQQANRLLRAYREMDYAKVEKIRAEVPEDKQKGLDEAVRKAIKNQYKKGEITEYDAIRQLQKYGGASDQILGNFIKDEYKAGNIQKGDAVKQLMQYCGKDQKAAEKTIRDLDAKEATGLSYNDIDDAYELGDITAAQARDALVKYGLDKDKADMKVEYWTYRNAHPGTSLTDGKFETYWKNYHSMMTPAVYEDFKLAWDAVPGTDKDHDGKADANSKKPDRIKLIDSLPITKEQKDILFQMEWKTGLEDAPWHT